MKVLKGSLNFDLSCESDNDFKRLFIMHSMAYSCVIGAKWGDYHCAKSSDYHCANWGDLSVCQLGRFVFRCQMGRL